MKELFAMSGLHDTIHRFELLLGFGGLVLVAYSAVASFYYRSRIAAGIAVILTITVTCIFNPWQVIRPVQHTNTFRVWVDEWQVFDWWWIVTTVATVLAAVRAFVFPARMSRLKPATPPS